MSLLQPTPRQLLLLNAVLCPQPGVAAASWKRWSAEVVLEEAPPPELRLLPAAYANLSRISPDLKLPEKLRGNARATFTRNQLLMRANLPAISGLAKKIPLVAGKGMALCARFNAWSARQMGDSDIYIHHRDLPLACDLLADLGWLPKYGMTWASLKYRTPERRISWNLTRQHGDLDLHWRFVNGPLEQTLAKNFWETTVPGEVLGQKILIPSPEIAVIAALVHGFIEGTSADRLQALVDVTMLLPACDALQLSAIMQQAGLWEIYQTVDDVLRQIVAVPTLPVISRSEAPGATDRVRRALSRSISPAIDDSAVLARPALYRLWQALGHPRRIERLLLRLAGPLSKPLAPSGIAREEYDLRDCSTIDEIGGPGWGWPEPEHTCFWSDQADNRLLFPVSNMSDHVIVLTLSETWSPNPNIVVYANGIQLLAIDLHLGGPRTKLSLIVPRWVLIGHWIEIAIRPNPYAPNRGELPDYVHRRCIPAARLSVIPPDGFDAALATSRFYSKAMKLLGGKEPESAKFQRISAKIAASSYAKAPDLPKDFDPIVYVLSYPDLFEAEVDPYEHFLIAGHVEGRSLFKR